MRRKACIVGIPTGLFKASLPVALRIVDSKITKHVQFLLNTVWPAGISSYTRSLWHRKAYSPFSWLSLPVLLPEARQPLWVVAHDQLARAVAVPVCRKEGSVIAIGKALVEQRDDPHVGFRADEAAGGLHDAVHAGVEIGIGEAMLIFIFVVRADQLLLKIDPRQAR